MSDLYAHVGEGMGVYFLDIFVREKYTRGRGVGLIGNGSRNYLLTD